MDLDPDKFEAVVIIEQARFAGMSAPEFANLSPYWKSWYAIAHQAEQKAAKRRDQESD